MSSKNHLTESAAVLRATEYPQELDEYSRDHKLTHLAVYQDAAVAGRVTLTARGSNIESPYGFEFDLSPTDARRVAHWLLRAAHAAK